MSNFVHLHLHTSFSLLESTIRIKDLVNLAKEMGMEALGVTDSGNLFGSLHFFKACKAAGINPVVGCEIQMARTSMENMNREDPANLTDPFILLATSERGYLNLSSLTSGGYTLGYLDKPRIDEDFLSQYTQDLIGLSGGHHSLISKLLLDNQLEAAEKKALRFQEILGKGNFYLELQDHGLEEEMSLVPLIEELSQRTGIPMVATNDVHYLGPEDSDAQDTLLCIKESRKKNDFSEVNLGEGEYYFKSAEEMESLFGHIPEALENTLEIARRCNVNIPEPGPLLPAFDIPAPFQGEEDYLRHLIWEGLKNRYDLLTPEIEARAEFELKTILEMGFPGYFLIVWDFINYAKQHDIPVGPGRGSGAGSIVAYALEITDLDPLEYELLFERFLNPERVSMPDFDIDFCFERRGEVIDYVTRKYGKDRVAQIITFGTLKAKAVLKDVSRALDIRFSESNLISSLVPGDPKMTIPKALEEEPRLTEIYQRGGIYKELIDTASKLEGLHRHTSTHAAGVVIGKDLLTNFTPLYRDPKTGAISTQFTMDIIEPCGLVKMDFLGLKTLTLIKHTIDMIHEAGITFSEQEIKDKDEKTFALLGDGKSTCVFQFESAGMQKILKQAKPGNIEDLIALNALYRPGPMQYIPQFIDSKLGKTPITYPDPSLEETLKPTYGVIVYQEQVMKVAQIIGGFSLGKADILRRAMGKKKIKDMEKMKVEFIAGAKEIGHSEEHAAEIFHMLEPFAGYGFNKSHAAAYSVVAYKTAYLKAHFPAQFMAANLTNELASQEKLGQYIAEAKSLGLEIVPPHVNSSRKVFSVKEGKIIFGLMGVKNLGEGPCEEILRVREKDGPFKDFVDFLRRVDQRAIGRKVIETGIQAGLFDGLGPTRAALWENWPDLVLKVQKEKEATAFGQGSLFDGEEVQADFSIPEVPEWDAKQRITAEKSLTGFFFSGHPLDDVKDLWKQTVNINLARATSATGEESYQIMGVLTAVRVINTKKGDRMAWATLEDYNGSIELVFFPKVFATCEEQIELDAILGFKGKVEARDDKAQFLVDAPVIPDELKVLRSLGLHLEIQGMHIKENQWEDLREVFLEHPGKSQIFLHLKNAQRSAVVKTHGDLKVDMNGPLWGYLEQQPWISRVWKE